MKTERIIKLSSFLKIIESQASGIQKSNKDDILLFRGQSVDLPLLPKICRDYECLKNLPLPYKYDLFSYETMMLDDFKRRSKPYLDSEPASDWDWLTIAQHHGMKTRLLDWSENPLVGLYFALLPNNNIHTYDNHKVVWILRISKKEIVTPSGSENLFNLAKTKVFMPNIVSNRLISQAGWFTVHKYSKKINKFVPLERNVYYKKLLTKVIIDNSNADIKRHLDLCGINSSSLFTDLDGLCNHINDKEVLYNIYHIPMPMALKKKTKTR